MTTFIEVPKSGDPASFPQRFEAINIQVLCCRYWWLEKWRSNKMSFPYWRLYWNKNTGAYVRNQTKYNLSPDKIILIPPNTEFSTDIEYRNDKSQKVDYELEGNRVAGNDEENTCLQHGEILHLFIHFNLGNPLDNVIEEIHSISINTEQGNFINSIISKLLVDNEVFSIQSCLSIHHLILSSISQIDSKKLTPKYGDARLIKILNFVDINYSRLIENSELAQCINMSTNSFTRYFRERIQMSPQEYIRKIRINKACHIMDHTDVSIDIIADQFGFSDRYHFSKVFKKIKGIPPAEYKKRFILK